MKKFLKDRFIIIIYIHNIFAMNPAMLFIDAGAFDVALIVVTSLVGLYSVAGGLEGYMMDNMNIIQRLMAIFGGLFMLIPGAVTDIIGIAVVVLCCAWQILNKKKKVAKTV